MMYLVDGYRILDEKEMKSYCHIEKDVFKPCIVNGHVIVPQSEMDHNCGR